MSFYQDLIADFPERCWDVLLEGSSADSLPWRDREVTRLLLLAATAFVVPYERLRPPSAKFPSPVTLEPEFEKLRDKLIAEEK